MTGCSRVSPGCAHCYAATLAPRLARMGQRGYTELPWVPENAAANVMLHPDRLDRPLRWTRPRLIFVNSMSDLFHEQVPDEFIDQVFAVMALSPRHTFQILTKRPERMRAWVQEWSDDGQWRECSVVIDGPALTFGMGGGDRFDNEVRRPWPLPNVWLGTSVENETWAERRIPELLATPAAVRFLSCEPLLGPVDLTAIPRIRAEGFMRPLDGRFNRIDWVIAGGESGPGHRPMDPDWVRSLRDQCADAGVPFFLKQLGGARAGGEALLDGRHHRDMPPVAR